jgi:hypothetical protein
VNRLWAFIVAPVAVFIGVYGIAFFLFGFSDKFIRPFIDPTVEGRETLWEPGEFLSFLSCGRCAPCKRAFARLRSRRGAGIHAPGEDLTPEARKLADFKAETASAEKSELLSRINFAAWFSTMLVLPASISASARAQLCAANKDGGFLIDNAEISCQNNDYKEMMTISFYVGYVYVGLPVILAVVLAWAGSKASRKVQAIQERHEDEEDEWEYDLDVARREGSLAAFYKRVPRPVPPSIKPKDLEGIPELFRRVLTIFEFLYEGYRLDAGAPYGWECVVMVRKALFMGLATGFIGLKDSRTQIVATMFLLSVSLAAHVFFQPYRHKEVNILEGLALMGEMTFTYAIMTRLGVVGALTATAPTSSSTSMEGLTSAGIPVREQFAFDLIAVVFSIPFVFMWFFFLVDAYIFKGGLAMRAEVVGRAMARTWKRFKKLFKCNCCCCASCRPSAQPKAKRMASGRVLISASPGAVTEPSRGARRIERIIERLKSKGIKIATYAAELDSASAGWQGGADGSPPPGMKRGLSVGGGMRATTNPLAQLPGGAGGRGGMGGQTVANAMRATAAGSGGGARGGGDPSTQTFVNPLLHRGGGAGFPSSSSASGARHSTMSSVLGSNVRPATTSPAGGGAVAPGAVKAATAQYASATVVGRRGGAIGGRQHVSAAAIAASAGASGRHLAAFAPQHSSGGSSSGGASNGIDKNDSSDDEESSSNALVRLLGVNAFGGDEGEEEEAVDSKKPAAAAAAASSSATGRAANYDDNDDGFGTHHASSGPDAADPSAAAPSSIAGRAFAFFGGRKQTTTTHDAGPQAGPGAAASAAAADAAIAAAAASSTAAAVGAARPSSLSRGLQRGVATASARILTGPVSPRPTSAAATAAAASAASRAAAAHPNTIRPTDSALGIVLGSQDGFGGIGATAVEVDEENDEEEGEGGTKESDTSPPAPSGPTSSITYLTQHAKQNNKSELDMALAWRLRKDGTSAAAAAAGAAAGAGGAGAGASAGASPDAETGAASAPAPEASVSVADAVDVDKVVVVGPASAPAADHGADGSEAEAAPTAGTGWRRYEDSTDVWYHNTLTGESVAEPPAEPLDSEETVYVHPHPLALAAAADGAQAEMMSAGTGWRRYEDSTDVWYHNTLTGESVAEPPAEPLDSDETVYVHPHPLALAAAADDGAHAEAAPTAGTGWRRYEDSTDVWYHNTLTGESVAEPPAEPLDSDETVFVAPHPLALAAVGAAIATAAEASSGAAAVLGGDQSALWM